jgi:hypothetical protein
VKNIMDEVSRTCEKPRLEEERIEDAEDCRELMPAHQVGAW